jgi:hypothetical protein
MSLMKKCVRHNLGLFSNPHPLFKLERIFKHLYNNHPNFNQPKSLISHLASSLLRRTLIGREQPLSEYESREEWCCALV